VYLVDTNVISAGSPTKAQATPDLAAWMQRHDALLFVSVITVAEIADGIAKARREGAGRKADRLAEWFETVLHLYASRVLSLDLPAARWLGILSDRARSAGHAPGFADLAIAATAQLHGMTILTRNLRHFRMLEIPAVDPFERLPD
jgi:predicted nucleic acid-binding protein